MFSIIFVYASLFGQLNVYKCKNFKSFYQVKSKKRIGTKKNDYNYFVTSSPHEQTNHHATTKNAQSLINQPQKIFSPLYNR